jgi:hypothetical protein
MENAIAMALTQFFIHNPKRVWLVSLFGIIVSGVFGYTSYREIQRLPLQPEHLSLEDVVEKLNYNSNPWVTIEPVQWDCQNIRMDYKDFGTTVSLTYISFTNQDQSIVGMAYYSEKKTCEEVMSKGPTGTVTWMNAKAKAFYTKKGVNFTKYSHATAYVDLCSYCGRGNSELGLICAPFIFLGCLALPVMTASSSRKKDRWKDEVGIYG